MTSAPFETLIATARSLPKVLLHEHLDGSLRPATLLELLRQRGIRPPAEDVPALAAWFEANANAGSLPKYLEGFTLTVAAMAHPLALERVAFEAAEDARQQGALLAEFRIAPLLFEAAGLDGDATVEALLAGLRRSALPSGLIVCAMRQLPVVQTMRAAELALRCVPAPQEARVLEIGTGWGGWSLHAARTHGCRVTTVTISRQQHDLAVRRVAEAGLTGRVDVRLQDFRDITGRFDKLVSIEMLEAVGHRNQEAFAEMVARVLPAEGIAALQFITCPDSRYEEFRRGVDFIQKHIFPGSLLLSVNRMNDLLTRAGGFVLHRLEDFGTDYARTLRLWRESFHARLDAVQALGFDERFVRKWTYYLCYCEAAFALRNISVVHTVHTRANNAAL